jgi:hypothetical protein
MTAEISDWLTTMGTKKEIIRLAKPLDCVCFEYRREEKRNRFVELNYSDACIPVYPYTCIP